MIKKFLVFLLIFIVINTINCKLKFNKGNFKIIFWDYKININKQNNNDSIDKLEEIVKLSYNELKNKYKPRVIITDNFINKYYWDEQIIEVDFQKLLSANPDTALFSYWGYFTIILNDKIIYHGLDRTVPTPKRKLYDDSEYPAIISAFKREDTTKKIIFYYLIIQPKFSLYDDTLKYIKNYNTAVKDKIFNKEIYKFFKLQKKIVKGDNDINNLVGYNFRGNKINNIDDWYKE